MPDWVLWTILAVLMAAGEVATTGFILGPIAIAAVAAAVVAAAGGGILLELLVFIAGSIATLLFIRPVATRHLRMPARIRTGTAALVGARALVLEEVSANGGQVKIGGEVWSARAYDEDQVIPAGARVEVVKIEGATALVYE
jgi:membrane protein implicated in regulation of membrane protease activity